MSFSLDITKFVHVVDENFSAKAMNYVLNVFYDFSPTVEITAKIGEKIIFNKSIDSADFSIDNREKIKELVYSKEWIPISLKKINSVKDAENLELQDIVLVKVSEFASLGFKRTTVNITNNLEQSIKKERDLSTIIWQVNHFLNSSLDSEAMYQNIKNSLMEKLSEPLNEEIEIKAEVELLKCNELEFKGSNSRKEWDAILQQRTGGSNTIAQDKTRLDDWKRAAEFIEEKARNRENLLLEDILKVNELLSGDAAEELEAGKLRELQILAGGMGEGVAYPARDKEGVQELIDDYMDWLEYSIDLCDEDEANPLIVGAMAYQRMVSIHPFCEGNGRTARLVMDYVLLRYNIPPPSLGENVNDAIYGDQPLNESRKAIIGIPSSPSTIINKVIEGVKKSREIIQGLTA